MRLLRAWVGVAVGFFLLYLVTWWGSNMAPVTPGPWEGVDASEGIETTEPVDVGRETTEAPLPSGFPSMELPPPEIDVPAGQPQPIDTKFGWTYEIPADWRNFSKGIVSWSSDEESFTLGSVGMYGYDYCPGADGARLADTGMTGRRGVDIATAAFEVAQQAEVIFGDSEFSAPSYTYSDPIDMTVAGQQAVRYTVHATEIHQDLTCDPVESYLDVVALPGFATAPVAVFVVKIHRGVDGALDHSAADELIATLARTPERRDPANGQ